MNTIKSTDEASSNPPSISFAEIFLIVTYFLLAWFLPTSWLDTAVGNIAFDIARTVNPYLSEYSIAYAEYPAYFIHCHVIATILIPPLLPWLIIRRNGGREKYSKYWVQRNRYFGGSFIHFILTVPFFFVIYISMFWLVDYPLTRGEWAIWIGAVSPSAFMLSGTIGICIVFFYMIIFSAFSYNRG